MQLIIVYNVTCKSILRLIYRRYSNITIIYVWIILRRSGNHISRDGFHTIVISKARVLCKFHICRFNLLRVWYALGASKSVFDVWYLVSPVFHKYIPAYFSRKYVLACNIMRNIANRFKSIKTVRQKFNFKKICSQIKSKRIRNIKCSSRRKNVHCHYSSVIWRRSEKTKYHI